MTTRSRRTVFTILSAPIHALIERIRLDAGYRAMARDKEHEAEAMEWCEALIGDLDLDDEDWSGHDATA